MFLRAVEAKMFGITETYVHFQEDKKMKKALFLAMIIFLLISCATAIIPVKPISQADLKDLKGEWTGERHSQAAVNRTDLKIYNDSLPLRGEVILDRKGR